jgi:hypothetical protein
MAENSDRNRKFQQENMREDKAVKKERLISHRAFD